MNNQITCKNKQHVNVGTVGHVDHGVSNIAKGISMATISTGDWIDPTPWTPEDHDRFKKAIDQVHELENLEVKREIQKSISAGAGVIYVGEEVNK